MSLPDRKANPFADSAPNPYAPPQGPALNPLPAWTGEFAGLWRQGDMLVMDKRAPLPPICVKSNEPATQRLERKLQWHPEWVIIIVLFNLLIGLIIMLILQKKATVVIGLTDEWAARRKTRMLIAWGMGLTALAMIVGGIVAAIQAGPGAPSETIGLIFAFCFLGGILLALTAIIYGQYACRLIYAKKINDNYVWIKGVHPGFLDRLDVWAGT